MLSPRLIRALIFPLFGALVLGLFAWVLYQFASGQIAF